MSSNPSLATPDPLRYNGRMPLHLTQVAKKLAHDAGRMALRMQKQGCKVSTKGKCNDLVTEADEAIDKFLIKSILSHFPDHGILTEESGHIEGKSDFKWIIDPIDGTTNFANGIPFFSISIAVVQRGKPIIGVVDIPGTKEQFWAQEGKGAYLGRKHIHVSKTGDLKKALVATGFPYDRSSAQYKKTLKVREEFQHAALGVRRMGSAAIDLCYLAAGRFDGFWEYGLKSWDIAAGKIILEEAGGTITNMDGSRLNPKKEELLASNGLLHQTMMDLIN